MKNKIGNVWNEKIKEALKEMIAVIWIMACMAGFFAIWIYLIKTFPAREIEIAVFPLATMTLSALMVLLIPGIAVIEKSKIQLCNRGLEGIESIAIKTCNKIRRKMKKSAKKKRISHIPAI